MYLSWKRQWRSPNLKDHAFFERISRLQAVMSPKQIGHFNYIKIRQGIQIFQMADKIVSSGWYVSLAFLYVYLLTNWQFAYAVRSRQFLRQRIKQLFCVKGLSEDFEQIWKQIGMDSFFLLGGNSCEDKALTETITCFISRIKSY